MSTPYRTMWVLERAKLEKGRLTFDPATLEVRVFTEEDKAERQFRRWSRTKLGPEQYVLLSVYLKRKRTVCAIKADENVRWRLGQRFPEIGSLGT